MQIVQLQQGTPEWHAWRQGGIGGSDMPVLFGVSRFKTKHQLWLEKQGLGKKDTSNSYIKARGHKHEITLRAYAEAILDEPLAVTCLQGERPWQRVSLDGITSDGATVVEAKMMKREDFIALRDSMTIPVDYAPQVAHQIDTAGAERCLFVGLNEAMDEKAHVMVARGSHQLAHLDCVERGDAFWKLVQSGEEPEPEGDEIITLTDAEALALANEFRVAKEYADDWAKKQKALAEKIAALLPQDKRKLVCGDLSLIRFPKKGNVDYASIPQLAGVDLEAFRKKPSYQTRINLNTQGAK